MGLLQPTSSRVISVHADPTRRLVADAQGPVDSDQDYEHEHDNRPKRSIADAMEEAFDDGDSDDER